uniref:SRS domain containing protein, putative n=1 Tax=Toxoplasma gondii (strain ATCC 50861 / VEG) TaxID=432359 RepID=A0A0F7VB27_TOXGV|nr:TPA: SRS domain containing protein, putative [Toxoplasma gondii VEG]
MGSFQVSKCFASVVGAATLVALSCLSACATASGTPITCTDTLDFTATSLRKPQSEVLLKCPQGAVIFPALESQQFCQHAGCTNQVQLSSASVTSKESSAGDHSDTRKKTDEFILTLSADPSELHTLYIQCKAPTR